MSDGVDEPAHPPRQLRTRGAFTTRDNVLTAESMTQGAAALVGALRKALGPLPICLATYAKTKEDESVLDWILPHLEDRDTLWVIGSGEKPERREKSFCYLDLRKDADETHMRHLVADALLLPRREAKTPAVLQSWDRRAGLIVVDAAEDAPAKELALLKTFPGVSLRFGGGLFPSRRTPMMTSAWHDVFARLRSLMPTMEESATKLRDLRRTFAPFADNPALLTRIVECVEFSDWKSWAADALPACYVSIPEGQPGRAFIWSYLEECFGPDDIKVVRRCCNDAVIEAEVTQDADHLGQQLNTYVRPVLAARLNTSEGMYGAVSQALWRHFDEHGNTRVRDRADSLMSCARAA